MNLVGHDFHGQDLVPVPCLLGQNQIFAPPVNWRPENLPSVFRAPDDVLLAARHVAMIAFVWFAKLRQLNQTHVPIVERATNTRQEFQLKLQALLGVRACPHIPPLKQMGFTGFF